MAVLDTLLTTAAGAVSATLGVLVGGVVTRRGQDRQWTRDKQLAAYVDLLRHYSRFTMAIKRSTAGGGWDYDWGEWSAALTAASIVAPADVATEIDAFGRAVGVFLDRTARVGGTLTAEQFEEASVAPARAQVALVNAMRRSLGNPGPLTFSLGGSLPARPPS